MRGKRWQVKLNVDREQFSTWQSVKHVRAWVRRVPVRHLEIVLHISNSRTEPEGMLHA
jgi:hypothetical protein